MTRRKRQPAVAPGDRRWPSRPLEVLYLDDEPPGSLTEPGGHGRHFKIGVLKSYKEVQHALAGTGNVYAPDIILYDISFGADDKIAAAAIHGHTDRPLIPVGPLFTLPFLNSRDVVYLRPYSVYLRDPKLTKFTYFLLPMGLLAAKQVGKTFKSGVLEGSNRKQPLEQYVESLQGITNPTSALRDALPQYRKILKERINTKILRIVNPSSITDMITSMERQFDSSPEEWLPLPDDVSVELVGPRGRDRISLRSLFADQLSWVNEVINFRGLQIIHNFFAEAKQADPSFAAAIEVIQKQNDVQEKTNTRPDVEQVIRELFPLFDTASWHEVLRLCVLFANIHAWAMNMGHSFQKNDVYRQLGDRYDQHIYLSLFGARRNRIYQADRILPGKLDVPPLPAFSHNSSGNEQYFVNDKSTLAEEDDQRVHIYLNRFWECDISLPYDVN